MIPRHCHHFITNAHSMGGFYESGVIDVLVEAEECLTSYEIWIQFTKIRANFLNKFHGANKKHSVDASLTKLHQREYVKRSFDIEKGRFVYFLDKDTKIAIQALCML